MKNERPILMTGIMLTWSDEVGFSALYAIKGQGNFLIDSNGTFS